MPNTGATSAAAAAAAAGMGEGAFCAELVEEGGATWDDGGRGRGASRMTMAAGTIGEGRLKVRLRRPSEVGLRRERGTHHR